jgi:hypothetical protein
MRRAAASAILCLAAFAGISDARGDDWWHGFPPDRPDPWFRGYWQPGGFEARIGTPRYYSVPYTRTIESFAADPYITQFSAGFYREAEYGHFRFPHYSYRRPWYFPGPPTYVRDTNVRW